MTKILTINLVNIYGSIIYISRYNYSSVHFISGKNKYSNYSFEKCIQRVYLY